MRFSLIKLAQEAAKSKGVPKVAQGEMTFIPKEGRTALAKKYNYTVRPVMAVDDLHGYAIWCMKYKAAELWPLMACFVLYGGFASYIIWWTFQKTEVQLNRFSEHKPWDWERAQYAFEKRHKAFFNDSAQWGRIPELDKLQAEMLQVKQERMAAYKASKHGHH